MFIGLLIFAIVAFMLAVAIIGLVLKLLWWAIAGAIIGALARLVLPGEQHLGVPATALCGIGGAFAGAIVGHRLLHWGTVLTFVASVAIAAALVAGVSSGATSVQKS